MQCPPPFANLESAGAISVGHVVASVWLFIPVPFGEHLLDDSICRSNLSDIINKAMSSVDEQIYQNRIRKL